MSLEAHVKTAIFLFLEIEMPHSGQLKVHTSMLTIKYGVSYVCDYYYLFGLFFSTLEFLFSQSNKKSSGSFFLDIGSEILQFDNASVYVQFGISKKINILMSEN